MNQPRLFGANFAAKKIKNKTTVGTLLLWSAIGRQVRGSILESLATFPRVCLSVGGRCGEDPGITYATDRGVGWPTHRRSSPNCKARTNPIDGVLADGELPIFGRSAPGQDRLISPVLWAGVEVLEAGAVSGAVSRSMHGSLGGWVPASSRHWKNQLWERGRPLPPIPPHSLAIPYISHFPHLPQPNAFRPYPLLFHRSSRCRGRFGTCGRRRLPV